MWSARRPLFLAVFKCNIVFFQLASQPLCDVTVLQQIDEETTCDNNPWTLKWTSKPLQIAGTVGFGHTSIYDSRKSQKYICVFSVCDWEGKLAKKLSTLTCLYHIKYYSCTKCKGSACTRVFKCFSRETSRNMKLSVRLLRRIFVMTFTKTDFRDIKRVFKEPCRIISCSCFFLRRVLWY